MLSKKIRAYKETNPKAKAKEIATAVGCKPAYVYQVLLNDAKKDKPEPKPTEGQQVLRKEITRLNEEITKYKNPLALVVAIDMLRSQFIVVDLSCLATQLFSCQHLQSPLGLNVPDACWLSKSPWRLH